ncbi:lysophospholipase [Schaalia sp. ZJ405]|uniref:alpha/beta hydrolase n=1 Tax=unclassified Schaalia TaxID=2691889 RepID=UPI0013EA65AF|nr:MULTISPECIES: alpha/beta hydrolase [unclassified Schaalia]QPK81596.1 lysophospholipase [Schaalia sp. ZJ405]
MDLHFLRANSAKPHGTVLVAHGYAEHSGRYFPLFDALTASGYDVAYYDHAGHGTASGPRARVDVGRLIKDHLDARRIVLTHARTRDIFLFGHSMGGLITGASTLIDSSHLRGTVLSGPAFRPISGISPDLARKLLPLARMCPGLIASPGDLPNAESKLSRDPAVQAEFDADILNWHGGVALLTGATMLVQGDESIRHAHRLSTPMLILHGDQDRLAHLDGSREFVAAALEAHPDLDLELRIIPGAYHEVLNEPEGPQLITDIVEWLNAHR